MRGRLQPGCTPDKVFTLRVVTSHIVAAKEESGMAMAPTSSSVLMSIVYSIIVIRVVTIPPM